MSQHAENQAAIAQLQDTIRSAATTLAGLVEQSAVFEDQEFEGLKIRLGELAAELAELSDRSAWARLEVENQGIAPYVLAELDSERSGQPVDGDDAPIAPYMI